MKRFLLASAVLVGLFLPYSAAVMPEVEDVISLTDIELSVDTSTAIETVPFVPQEQRNPEPDWLIPHIAGRDIMPTKEYCDERAGISRAYQDGREPTHGQYLRFDWCQQSLNRQQGI